MLSNSKYCQDSSTTKSTLIDTFQLDCDSASSTDNHDFNNTDLLLQNQDGKYSGDRKSYQFVLTQNEWLSLYESKRAVTLHREWTNVFNKNLLTFFPFCVLKFLYHRINLNFARINCPYFVAEAKCKFARCVSLRITIDRLPRFANQNLIVTVIANGTLSRQHFDNETSHSRKLSGQARKLVAEELNYTLPSKYHYEQFDNTFNLTVASHGNMNSLKSADVIRKIQSEDASKCRFSDEMFQDVLITQKTYDSNIKGTVFNGYIQTISRNPFLIHFVTEEQIRLLKKIPSEKFTLHLDATGSVIRKLDKTHKSSLYYALTIKHPFSKVSPIPLAEMISSDQTNVEITHFLLKWRYNVKKVLQKDITPTHIEVDFSWPMLHSTCNAFNSQSLEIYLTNCWERLDHSDSEVNSINSIIHICSAHIMHRFSYKLEKKSSLKPTKRTKRIIMYIMARLTSSTTLEDISQLFTALCMSCFSKLRYPETKLYITKLQDAILLTVNNNDNTSEIEYLEELDEEMPNKQGDSLTYKDKSPFGKHFQNIYNKCSNFIQNLSIKYMHHSFEENNELYLPDLPDFLATHYMPISPLWTGLMLGPILYPGKVDVTFTNSIAENWMRIVKISILQNETKLRPGDFIRKVREGISGRIKAFDFAFLPISNKLIKRIKVENNDNTQVEEIWKRGKRSKRSYFRKAELSTARSKDNQVRNKGVSTQNCEGNKKKLRKRRIDCCRIQNDHTCILGKNNYLHVESNELSSDDSILVTKSDDIQTYDHGEFSPVNPSWQKERCKEMMLTFVDGLFMKIRQLINP